MRYSNLVNRLDGPGYRSWDVHMKAKQMMAAGEQVILLTIGDPDFDTPAPILDAAIQSLRSGRTHYTPSLGEMKLRAKIAEFHTKQSGQQVAATNVAVVAGAQCALYTAAMCIFEAGDEVIVFDPVYSTYDLVIGATGAKARLVKLRPELGFHFDPADLQAAVTPRTRAIIINSPHNPTGAMLSPEELESIADLCTQHDLWLLYDEVYSHFAYTRPHLNPGTISALSDRTIVISSLSKSHAMTGWRLGWMIAPEKLIEYAGDLLAAMLFGQPPFIQDAALAALSNDWAEVEQMRLNYATRCNLICSTLKDAGKVSCLAPEGGIYVMVDVRNTGMTAYNFAHRLLECEKVGLLPGDAFSTSLHEYLRLSLTAPDDQLAEACHRIQRFGESL